MSRYKTIAILIGVVVTHACGARQVDLDVWRARSGPCAGDEIGAILCGSYALPVSGTVAFTDDKTRPRFQDLKILTGYFSNGEWTLLRAVDTTVGPVGDFAFEARGSYSVREVCRDGKWDSAEIHLAVHHLFRASGCLDVVVASTRESSDHAITMDCAR